MTNETDVNIPNYQFTDEEINELIKTKQDFLNGKTTARSWEQVKEDLTITLTKIVKMQYPTDNPKQLAEFLNGKSEQSLMLFDHFLTEFVNMSPITLHPAKTMIGISNGNKRIAWVTQFGKSFLHVVFPFKQPYNDNLCFQKIAQVPDDNKQYNHHFRMLQNEDVNDEVKAFMKRAWKEEK